MSQIRSSPGESNRLPRPIKIKHVKQKKEDTKNIALNNTIETTFLSVKTQLVATLKSS